MINKNIHEAVLNLSSESRSYEAGAQVNEALSNLKGANPKAYNFLKEKMESAMEHGVTLRYVALIDPQGEIDRVKRYLLTDDVVGQEREKVEAYISELEDWIVKQESL